MTTAPLKSRLTLGSWLGLAGFAGLLFSLMLSIGAPEVAAVFVWLAGAVALAGAGLLMLTGLTWYRRLRERERRDHEAPDARSGR